MSKKLPAFQFYPGDWMKDPSLRACSLSAKGLWIDMLCLMWESTRRGFLVHATGHSISIDQLARMVGGSLDEVSGLVNELFATGVCSRTSDGILYSRRLERDDRKAKACSDAGKSGGGNPNFGKTLVDTHKGIPKGTNKGMSKGMSKGMPKQNANSSSSSSSSLEKEEINTASCIYKEEKEKPTPFKINSVNPEEHVLETIDKLIEVKKKSGTEVPSPGGLKHYFLGKYRENPTESIADWENQIQEFEIREAEKIRRIEQAKNEKSRLASEEQQRVARAQEIADLLLKYDELPEAQRGRIEIKSSVESMGPAGKRIVPLYESIKADLTKKYLNSNKVNEESLHAV